MLARNPDGDMAPTDFGRVADIYDATRSLPGNEMLRVVDALARLLPAAARVVDVGVGTGRFARPLQERGYDVAGLDISAKMMAKAREKGVTGLFFADVHRIPFRDRVFDTALLVHILHLVNDWTAVVRESARVSRESVISVVEVGAPGAQTTMGEEYAELRAIFGWPSGRFEEGEQGLEDVVAPERTVRVLDTQRIVQADERIAYLESKGQSITWDVPDDVHARIIGELRRRHGGATLRYQSSIELAVWQAERLRNAELHAQKS